MPAFDDYTPEELEPRARELTALLEQVSQQPVLATTAIPTHEQQAILARARARLTSAPAVTQHNTRPPLILLDPVEAEGAHQSLALSDANDSRSPVPFNPEKRRRSRFLHFVNALAAVLVVAALIAGSVALFANHASLTGGSRLQTTMSSVPCFLYETSNPGFPIDSGLRAVCQQHLYKDLQLVGKAGRYRVTLVRAYADRLRVAVQWKVEQLVNGQYISPYPTSIAPPNPTSIASPNPTSIAPPTVFIENAQTGQGQTFQKSQSPGQPLWGNDGITGEQGQIIWLTAPPILLPATTLHLHLDVRIVEGGAGSATIPFQFSLPLQPELRVVAINRTLNINGTSMTVKDMYLSPSEVFFEIAYTRGNIDLPSAKLTIGQTTCLDRDSQFLQASGSSLNIMIGCSAYTTHGPAHLVVSKDFGYRGVLGTLDFPVPAP